MATNTVIQLCITGADNACRIGPCIETKSSSSSVRTGNELNCHP
jgi:hypothetical protein